MNDEAVKMFVRYTDDLVNEAWIIKARNQAKSSFEISLANV
jgi:hypothetical protein